MNVSRERGADIHIAAKTMHSASEHLNKGKCDVSAHWPMKRHAKSKKDFEAVRLGVFAIPGPLLTSFGLRNRGLKEEQAVRTDAKELKTFLNSPLFCRFAVLGLLKLTDGLLGRCLF